MRRRQFITLVGGAAAAWPFEVRAQQASRVRVGFVDFAGENDPNALDRARVFKQGLERLGWAPMIDYYWSVFNVERAQRAARDVLKLTPEVIVCAGTLEYCEVPNLLIYPYSSRTNSISPST
jgi:putative tryptophan/tyrosine transport system substrate-binding protein